jgi:hypothetical protein
MPNWCSNVLTIKSTKQIIEKLRNDIKDAEAKEYRSHENGLFASLAPIPNYVEQDWYNLHNDYWGTKWDVPFEECYFAEESDTSISMAFDTAWGPPTGVCKVLYTRLVQEDPSVNVKCTFEEPGMDFIGLWENGEHEEWNITELYVKLIDGDQKAKDFANELGTDLETLAECYFCIDTNICHCYNCDPKNPVRGYQSGMDANDEAAEEEEEEEEGDDE